MINDSVDMLACLCSFLNTFNTHSGTHRHAHDYTVSPEPNSEYYLSRYLS